MEVLLFLALMLMLLFGTYAFFTYFYYKLLESTITHTHKNISLGKECLEEISNYYFSMPVVKPFPEKTPKKNISITSNRLTCPRCGRSLREVNGKYGKFLGCTGYPECKYTQQIQKWN